MNIWPTLTVQTKPKTEETMRTNKVGLITILAVGTLLVCGTAAIAQDSNKEGKGGKKGFPTVEERMDRMTEALKLTDDQKPKVKAALEDSQKKMQEIMADSSASREDRRDKMQTVRTDEGKKMKEILTAEQYTKYEEMRPARGGKKKTDGEKKE
jgi:Spy/CpxP family protein refolding chaperone